MSTACACTTSSAAKALARDAARERQHDPGAAAERLYELAAARYRSSRTVRAYTHVRGRWWGPRAQAALLRSMLARLGIELRLSGIPSARSSHWLSPWNPAATRSVVLASGYYLTARLDVPFMASPAVPVLGDLLRHSISLIARLLWPQQPAGLQPGPGAALLRLLPDVDGAATVAARCSPPRKPPSLPSAMRQLYRRSRCSPPPARRIATSTPRGIPSSSRAACRAASRTRRAPVTWCTTSIRRRVLHAIEVAAR